MGLTFGGMVRSGELVETEKDLLGGRTIMGLAPSASAARVLAREAGIPSRTLQWFLTRHGDRARVGAFLDLARKRLDEMATGGRKGERRAMSVFSSGSHVPAVCAVRIIPKRAMCFRTCLDRHRLRVLDRGLGQAEASRYAACA